MKQFLKTHLLLLIFFESIIGMSGSLYFSEIRHFIPCVLCWYQRICLYPIVLISAIGYFANDKQVWWYILPLNAIGLFISIYQNLLVYKFIPEAIAPCQNGVSCTTLYINWAGFITIPLLSFIAFLSMTIGIILHIVLNKTIGEIE